MTRPNIIYINSHDTGRYLQPYGYGFKSPAFQRLAEEGTMFRNMFCMGPTCSPSRAAMLTGMSPHSCGMIDLAHRGGKLKDYGKHLVSTLKKNGYYTALHGFQHVASDEEIGVIGYDEIKNDESKKRDCGHVIPDALSFLEQHASEEQPFYLEIGLFETHRPFPGGVTDEETRYVRPPAPIPDTPMARKDAADYQRSLNILDNGLKNVLDKLKETGLDNNTLIISTTDHGLPFPGMKSDLSDHGTGVYFFLKGPSIPEGKVIDGLTSQVDLFPTLCEFLDIEKPEWLQGVSMLPLIKDEAEEINEWIFAETTYHANNYLPCRSVRNKRWKYNKRFEENERSANRLGEGPVWKYWNEIGLKNCPAERERLYDLMLDPNEANNLADNPEFASIKAELESVLMENMKKLNDPILEGPINHPFR